MKKIFTSALVIFSLFSVNLLKAQKDYVVTLAGDTLRGEVFTTLFGTVKFADQSTGKEQKVSIANVKLYFISDDSLTYAAVKTSPNAKPQFLKRLLDGRIQLFEQFTSSYAGPGRAGTSNTFWYAIKGIEATVEIKTNNIFGSRAQRKENFNNLIADYPELLEDFKKEKNFSFEILKSYIRKYNYYFEHIKKETK